MTKHIHGRPGNEREFLDDLLGRGKGDPDVWVSPAEAEASQASVKKKHATTSEPINPTSTTPPEKKNYIGQKGKDL